MAGSSIENAYNLLKALFSGVLQDFIIAVLIILIGFIIGKILGKLIEKMMNEFEVDRFLRNVGNIRIRLSELVGTMVSFLIYFTAIILALNQLKLTSAVLKWIALAVVVAVIISLALSLKDFLPNVIAGIYLAAKKILEAGDIIKIKEVEGEIKRIGLVETIVEIRSGDSIYIPNVLLIKSEILKIKKTEKSESQHQLVHHFKK
ncbi:MAG TPA: mechanosensitive ion channel domain-containing protein [Candidatus Nanoarchaeia archaeon]|nr:mechanosensitive ion channel domain-containing protein [Candidatus Nanoarchaeia archaeon]